MRTPVLARLFNTKTMYALPVPQYSRVRREVLSASASSVNELSPLARRVLMQAAEELAAQEVEHGNEEG